MCILGVDVATAFSGLLPVRLTTGVGLGLSFVVELHPATDIDRIIILATINIIICLFTLSRTQ